jgi:hypothetical protein
VFILDSHVLAVTLNELLAFKTSEESADGFTRNPEHLPKLAVGHGDSQTNSGSGLIAFAQTPSDEYAGKFFRGRVREPKKSHTFMCLPDVIAQAPNRGQARCFVVP